MAETAVPTNKSASHRQQKMRTKTKQPIQEIPTNLPTKIQTKTPTNIPTKIPTEIPTKIGNQNPF